jgi:hypothetical protein
MHATLEIEPVHLNSGAQLKATAVSAPFKEPRENITDSSGRLMLRNLTLVELQEWFISVGENACQHMSHSYPLLSLLQAKMYVVKIAMWRVHRNKTPDADIGASAKIGYILPESFSLCLLRRKA